MPCILEGGPAMRLARITLLLFCAAFFAVSCSGEFEQSSRADSASAGETARGGDSETDDPPSQESGAKVTTRSAAYFNDFSTEEDGGRLDQFVAYRDPFVVNHVTGSSDHASTGAINCTAPEETRQQSRSEPAAHVYQCLPGGDAASGHQIAFAMDTSGHGFLGALPDQVFTRVSEVSVDINTTTAGDRNFVEIKVILADKVYVNVMPCIPNFPCNDGWDYDDIGGVGAGTDLQEGTDLTIATPAQQDGFAFDQYARVVILITLSAAGPSSVSRSALMSITSVYASDLSIDFETTVMGHSHLA